MCGVEGRGGGPTLFFGGDGTPSPSQMLVWCVRAASCHQTASRDLATTCWVKCCLHSRVARMSLFTPNWVALFFLHVVCPISGNRCALFRRVFWLRRSRRMLYSLWSLLVRVSRSARTPDFLSAVDTHPTWASRRAHKHLSLRTLCLAGGASSLRRVVSAIVRPKKVTASSTAHRRHRFCGERRVGREREEGEGSWVSVALRSVCWSAWACRLATMYQGLGVQNVSATLTIDAADRSWHSRWR